jgi:hypothetical protein
MRRTTVELGASAKNGFLAAAGSGSTTDAMPR